MQTCFVYWNRAIIRSLEELDGATQASYNDIVGNLVNRVGPINASTEERPADITSEELNNLDFTWIESANFSDILKESLSNMVMDMRKNVHCLY